MKSLKLILIICLLTTMSCTHKVVKKESINSICYIDSVKMKTSLRKIILMYIHQHPSYKSYCLHNESSKYYLNNGQNEEDINDKDNYGSVGKRWGDIFFFSIFFLPLPYGRKLSISVSRISAP